MFFVFHDFLLIYTTNNLELYSVTEYSEDKFQGNFFLENHSKKILSSFYKWWIFQLIKFIKFNDSFTILNNIELLLIEMWNYFFFLKTKKNPNTHCCIERKLCNATQLRNVLYFMKKKEIKKKKKEKENQKEN